LFAWKTCEKPAFTLPDKLPIKPRFFLALQCAQLCGIAISFDIENKHPERSVRAKLLSAVTLVL
jgi:hypothetical protein